MQNLSKLSGRTRNAYFIGLSLPSMLLTTFLRNCINAIKENHNDVKFRYVVTMNNPADITSRGFLFQNLISNQPWWNGPTWLSLGWPKQDPQPLFSMRISIKIMQLLSHRQTLTKQDTRWWCKPVIIITDIAPQFKLIKLIDKLWKNMITSNKTNELPWHRKNLLEI